MRGGAIINSKLGGKKLFESRNLKSKTRTIRISRKKGKTGLQKWKEIP